MSLSSEREFGIVKMFDDARGWGFITREGKPDLFVHYRGISSQSTARKTLHPKARVSFIVGEGPRGPVALNVVELD